MGSPIRILNVVVNMNRGGAETLLMNLYRNIDRTQVQFDFLTCKEGIFDAEILELGGRVHRIPYVVDVGHFRYIKALDQFFSTHPEYKIVHSHMDKMSGLVLRSAKKFDIPVRIAHSHNTSSEGGFAAKAYKWYVGKHILPSATHLLACSDSAAEWLFAGKADAVKVLKNGIDCDQFTYSSEIRKQIREELQLSNHVLVVGHVGRFNYQKNHSFLMDIFSKLNKDHPDSILLLAGDGPLRTVIEKKAADLNLTEKVKFLGIRSDINRLLQAFDLFVFPSIHEGLPVTLIEAQGAGLPCIISDAITKEVDMGIGLVEYCNLIDSYHWVDKMKSIAHRKIPRIIPTQALSQNGYDIKRTAESTTDFYLTISR